MKPSSRESITRSRNTELELDMFRLASGLFGVLIVSAFVFAVERAKPNEPPISVECHGQLRHGVVAIGGESTGTTITFDGTIWELDLKDDAARAFAESHHKKSVTILGSLRRVTSIEVPARWIVSVEQLSERDVRSHKEGASVTCLGMLRTTTAVPGNAATTVIEAAGITWQLDLTADANLPSKAKSLSRMLVIVKGRIERVPGTTFPQSTIIRVSKLDEPSTQK